MMTARSSTASVTMHRLKQERTELTRSTQLLDTHLRHERRELQLDWRKPAAAPAGGSTPRIIRDVAAVDAGRSSTRTNASAPAATVPAAPITQAERRESAAPSPVFDRATLDRLAENVLQRIERHVRIERERRGL